MNRAIVEPITEADVIASWAGLRPLLRTGEDERTADLSRRHGIRVSGAGVVTITGGKLTTYRAMAEDTIDQVDQLLDGRHRRCRTKHLPLVGAAGYTEPDPRVDLSGEDVRRKLLILARAAGLPLERAQVRVESLLPPDLADAPAGAVDDLLALLDAPLSAKLQAAGAAGHRLRFVARFDGEGASVGVRALPASHPLCAGSGTDNRVAVSSDRYPVQPLVIQGPGAGADVTAAALLDDVLRISAA